MFYSYNIQRRGEKIHRGVSDPAVKRRPFREVPSAHTGERGLQSGDTSRMEKKVCTITHARRGRPLCRPKICDVLPVINRRTVPSHPVIARSEATWQSVLLYSTRKYTAVYKETVPTTSVSTGLGMTEGFFILPFLFQLPPCTMVTPSAQNAIFRAESVQYRQKPSKLSCVAKLF